MSCRDWEDRIALVAGGDLEGGEAIRTRAHAEACAECAALLRDLEQNQAAFETMAAEETDAAALAHVRASVIGRLQSRRSRGLWLGWTFAGAAAATAMAIALLWSPLEPWKPIQPQPVPVIASRTTEAPAPVQRLDAPKPGARAARSRSKTAEPVLVKFFTDDPDVVILWTMNGEGELE